MKIKAFWSMSTLPQCHTVIYVCMYVCMYHTYVCMYTYIHINIHTLNIPRLSNTVAQKSNGIEYLIWLEQICGMYLRLTDRQTYPIRAPGCTLSNSAHFVLLLHATSHAVMFVCVCVFVYIYIYIYIYIYMRMHDAKISSTSTWRSWTCLVMCHEQIIVELHAQRCYSERAVLCYPLNVASLYTWKVCVCACVHRFNVCIFSTREPNRCTHLAALLERKATLAPSW